MTVNKDKVSPLVANLDLLPYFTLLSQAPACPLISVSIHFMFRKLFHRSLTPRFAGAKGSPSPDCMASICLKFDVSEVFLCNAHVM